MSYYTRTLYVQDNVESKKYDAIAIIAVLFDKEKNLYHFQNGTFGNLSISPKDFPDLEIFCWFVIGDFQFKILKLTTRQILALLSISVVQTSCNVWKVTFVVHSRHFKGFMVLDLSTYDFAAILQNHNLKFQRRWRPQPLNQMRKQRGQMGY